MIKLTCIVMHKNIIIKTVFITIIITSLGLSVWQFFRLYQKQQLISKIKLQESKSFVLQDLDHNDITDIKFANLQVVGYFLEEKTILLYGRHKNKYVMVTPMIISPGKVIMVARGMIPEKKSDSILNQLKIKQNKHLMNVSGIILDLEKKYNRFIPNNNLNSNIWFSLKKDDLEKYIGKKIENFYLLQTSQTDSDVQPLQAHILDKIPNNHLEYALTWLGLSFVAVIIFVRKSNIS